MPVPCDLVTFMSTLAHRQWLLNFFCIPHTLPHPQIRYAALDALCEVLIADRSQRLLERTGRRLDDFVHSLGGDKTTQQQQQPGADAEAGVAAGESGRE